MKAILKPLYLMILLSFISSTFSYAAQSVSIKLSPERLQNHLRTGTEVTLSITLLDTSSYPVQINEHQDRHAGEASYILDVHDALGKQLPLTEYGQKIYRDTDIFVPGFYRSILLEPGQSSTVSLRVDKVYDMSQPGIYTVSVSRKIDDRTGPHYVQSNEVTVTVTP